MKKLFVLAFIVIIGLVGVSNAQSIKTAEAIRLEVVEKLIKDSEKQHQNFESEKAELLSKYSPEYIKVKQVQEKINTLNQTLITLNLEKKQLLSKKLVENLPKDNIALLQMIVIQNEKIIDLLEKLVNK